MFSVAISFGINNNVQMFSASTDTAGHLVDIGYAVGFDVDMLNREEDRVGQTWFLWRCPVVRSDRSDSFIHRFLLAFF